MSPNTPQTCKNTAPDGVTSVKTLKNTPPCQKRPQNAHNFQNEYKWTCPGGSYPWGAPGAPQNIEILENPGRGYLQSRIGCPYKAL